MFKLNACKAHQAGNQRLLEILVKKGYTVDAFGHAKKAIDGKLYRYKFQSKTVRLEVQSVVPASRYSPVHKSWVRIKTMNYKTK